MRAGSVGGRPIRFRSAASRWSRLASEVIKLARKLASETRAWATSATLVNPAPLPGLRPGVRRLALLDLLPPGPHVGPGEDDRPVCLGHAADQFLHRCP